MSYDKPAVDRPESATLWVSGGKTKNLMKSNFCHWNEISQEISYPTERRMIPCNICNVDNVDNYLTSYLYNQTNTHLQINTINEYTFPFNTCEKVRDGFIAQPYSALINIINSFVILNFLTKTKTKHSFFLMP